MELTKLTWGVRKIIDHVTALAIAFSAFRHFIAAQGHDVRAKLDMFRPFVERHMPPAIPHLVIWRLFLRKKPKKYQQGSFPSLSA